MFKKLSKSLKDIVSIKADFFDMNDALLQRVLEVNNVYKSQPKRNECKCCGTIINKDSDFVNHGVMYTYCENCGHLNGSHSDTEYFTDFLYKESGGAHYSKNYLSDYTLRLENIYKPKVRFLCEALENSGVSRFSVTDFGCGGGHFVNSLLLEGISAKGFDISEELISLATLMWNQLNSISQDSPFVRVESEEELYDKLKQSSSDVVSFIGVLEHLRYPQVALTSFIDSNSNYLYFSVPLLSLTAFQENLFSHSFPRQLSGGHTHLYTHESIRYMLEKHSLSVIGEWHFGTDAMDLRRSMMIEMNKKGMSERMMDLFAKRYFSPELMDEIQHILDKYSCGSETHILAAKA